MIPFQSIIMMPNRIIDYVSNSFRQKTEFESNVAKAFYKAICHPETKQAFKATGRDLLSNVVVIIGANAVLDVFDDPMSDDKRRHVHYFQTLVCVYTASVSLLNYADKFSEHLGKNYADVIAKGSPEEILEKSASYNSMCKIINPMYHTSMTLYHCVAIYSFSYLCSFIANREESNNRYFTPILGTGSSENVVSDATISMVTLISTTIMINQYSRNWRAFKRNAYILGAATCYNPRMTLIPLQTTLRCCFSIKEAMTPLRVVILLSKGMIKATDYMNEYMKERMASIERLISEIPSIEPSFALEVSDEIMDKRFE